MTTNNIALLDCTLRDGGYANNWNFTAEQINSAVANLSLAGIDYIEIGYLTSITSDVNGTQFSDMESASHFLPKDRHSSKFVAMADVAQFDTAVLCERNANTVDGIRVVFYKRQIEQAYAFCDKIISLGYDLFLQPMVTVDYSPKEFDELVLRFQKSYPLYSVAIVDSFGCMAEREIEYFVKILNANISQETKIGFHGHDNMSLAMPNAISFLKQANKRQFIIDSSVSGMGRGAGNLSTELIANYINTEHGGKYDINAIMRVISDVAEPISQKYKWGYSPYLMLTAMHRAHPNFATFLLANHDISVNQFSEYLKTVPSEMLTKCTNPYVEELYLRFINGNGGTKQ
jgi:4-hydroxy 2-oxovalerate aldolase